MSLVHPRWARSVSAHGAILHNRAFWLIFQGLAGGDVGIVNIYAPTDSPYRCIFWEAIPQELPQSCRWVLVGDFNMVENRGDTTRQSGALIPFRERVLFEAMKTRLNVEDHSRSPGSLRFS